MVQLGSVVKTFYTTEFFPQISTDTASTKVNTFNYIVKSVTIDKLIESINRIALAKDLASNSDYSNTLATLMTEIKLHCKNDNLYNDLPDTRLHPYLHELLCAYVILKRIIDDDYLNPSGKFFTDSIKSVIRSYIKSHGEYNINETSRAGLALYSIAASNLNGLRDIFAQTYIESRPVNDPKPPVSFKIAFDSYINYYLNTQWTPYIKLYKSVIDDSVMIPFKSAIITTLTDPSYDDFDLYDMGNFAKTYLNDYVTSNTTLEQIHTETDIERADVFISSIGNIIRDTIRDRLYTIPTTNSDTSNRYLNFINSLVIDDLCEITLDTIEQEKEKEKEKTEGSGGGRVKRVKPATNKKGAKPAKPKNATTAKKTWERTDRKVTVKGGRGKPCSKKTVYRCSKTGELRVRKMVARPDGTKRATYVKF